MYVQNNMHRLVHSFKWGFLFDRIARALSGYETKDGKASEEEKKIILEGASFIDMVLNGGKQISTGVYQSNALESLMLYNKSLSIVLDMPDLPSEIDIAKIEGIFEELKSNLLEMGKGGCLSLEEVGRTKKFFNMLREATLDDSTTIMNGFYESRGSKKWGLPLET
jgi:hypothetical protein